MTWNHNVLNQLGDYFSLEKKKSGGRQSGESVIDGCYHRCSRYLLSFCCTILNTWHPSSGSQDVSWKSCCHIYVTEEKRTKGSEQSSTLPIWVRPIRELYCTPPSKSSLHLIDYALGARKPGECPIAGHIVTPNHIGIFLLRKTEEQGYWECRGQFLPQGRVG